MDRSFVTRTDIYKNDFLLEVIAAWDGPCPLDGNCVTDGCGDFPDPDCDPCGFNGQCASGCDRVDLDCAKGRFAGDFCDRNDDCESRRCVEALDDPRVKYCSSVCGSGVACEAPLTACQDSNGEQLCFFAGTTPSSQGAECTTGDDCRSGVCHPDDKVCIEECGDGFPACAEPFVCEKFASSRACVFESGGCGCRVGAPGAGGAALALGVVIALLGLRRRRRRYGK
jgi:MYXO-CTERM domain-containing protein